MEAVLSELERAQKKCPEPFNSEHEGFAILKEEVDEMWEEVKGTGAVSEAQRRQRLKKEAIQVAAMAMRFLIEVC